MVSVFSNHFFNWVLQLKGSGHEVYWFDVNDANTHVTRIDFVIQTVKWKRKFDYPGRQWIKKNFFVLDKFINRLNQRKLIDAFQQKFDEIQPDVIHSFEMYSSCVPILKIIKKHPKIKWIYSPWGTDLFYYQNEAEKLKGIKSVFNRLDYMFADCNRDSLIARKYGFQGEYLGTFPGGGGYELNSSNSWVYEFQNRKTILVKGYQNKFGRCNNVLEALLEIEHDIKDFEIIVFAATEEVLKFVDNPIFNKMKNLRIVGAIGREEVLKLMGKSLLYIGNSISDGMPNTLLEAIIMGAFPIQSNPGGASAEIIEHGKNGYLIENPENSNEIAVLIKKAIQNTGLLQSGITFNSDYIKPKLERDYIKEQVLKSYALVEANLKF
ncbi:glycosyltransferase [Gillisia hiemivivida]|uniref:Glycosyltransferase n=2 Tax=Gillisia hiemivivida TaxID=291190 RepID=A0A5C6ZVN1_9FLAO|nr:glycosyltransferase [Gillisia hiemivivida]